MKKSIVTLCMLFVCLTSITFAQQQRSQKEIFELSDEEFLKETKVNKKEFIEKFAEAFNISEDSALSALKRGEVPRSPLDIAEEAERQEAMKRFAEKIEARWKQVLQEVILNHQQAFEEERAENKKHFRWLIVAYVLFFIFISYRGYRRIEKVKKEKIMLITDGIIERSLIQPATQHIYAISQHSDQDMVAKTMANIIIQLFKAYATPGYILQVLKNWGMVGQESVNHINDASAEYKGYLMAYLDYPDNLPKNEVEKWKAIFEKDGIPVNEELVELRSTFLGKIIDQES